MEELADISLIKELPELTDLIVDEYEDEILSHPRSSDLHSFEYVSTTLIHGTSCNNKILENII